MKRRFTLKKIYFFMFLLIAGTSMYAQDLCSPVGWGSYNGSITGGGSATPKVASSSSELSSYLKSNSVVHISGTINLSSAIQLSGVSNLTIIGLPGSKLTNSNCALYFKSGCKNIIIQNVIFEGPGAGVGSNDNVTIEGGQRFWIDHCEFIDGGDGNIDVKTSSNYMTFTWCKFRYTSKSVSHQFSNLVASSDSDGSIGDYKITYQYCWWAEGCVERMPRVRFGQIHVANCYYNSSASKECVAPGYDANIRVEKCHFEGVDDPIQLGKLAGSAVVQSIDNIFTSCTGNQSGSGTAFTPPYSLTISDANMVKSIVTDPNCGAGQINPSNCSCGAAASYTLTTSTSGSGTITADPAGSSFIDGYVVTLTAAPNAGYEFASWSGDLSGSTNPATITMDGNKSVTATFNASSTYYNLTTLVSGEGSISLNPSGGSYLTGTEVTITANQTGSKPFTSWSGDLSGSTNPSTIIMDANKSVTANFELCTPAEISVSSVTATAADGTNVAENMIDNNIDTRWAVEGDADATFDLGVIYSLSSMDISYYKFTRNHLFEVSVSDDGSTYTTLESNGQSSGLETITVDLKDSKARYVRYTSHGNSGGLWANITEVDIYGCPYTPPTAISDISQNDFSFNFYPTLVKNIVTLSAYLPESGMVSANIMDVSGRIVKTLTPNILNKGANEITIDMSNLSSGIYFCKMIYGNKSVTKKIVKE